MKHKPWLIAAACLLAAGLILFGIVLALHGFDIDRVFPTQKYEHYEKRIDETIHSVELRHSDGDIRLLPSPDGTCSVAYDLSQYEDCEYEVKDGTLRLRITSDRPWYAWIGVGRTSTSITVYLPEGVYESVKLRTSSGDIRVRSLEAQTLELSATSGDICADGLRLAQLRAETRSGEVKLTDVEAEHFTVSATSGDIALEGCDGAVLDLRATSGDVKGTLRTGKRFDVFTSSGSVRVPADEGSDLCTIRTSSGDIRLRIE